MIIALLASVVAAPEIVEFRAEAAKSAYKTCVIQQAIKRADQFRELPIESLVEIGTGLCGILAKDFKNTLPDVAELTLKKQGVLHPQPDVVDLIVEDTYKEALPQIAKAATAEVKEWRSQH